MQLKRAAGWLFGRVALMLAGPRRQRLRRGSRSPVDDPLVEIYTFVNDEAMYGQMRCSFVAAGFPPDAFVRLSDANDDPYAAISRIGSDPSARYSILCHQDLRADQGAGAGELLAALQQLDQVDPGWTVAGTAGVARRGRIIRQLVDPHGGSTGEQMPARVVSLDENLLVLNSRSPVTCSPGLNGFHLYGTDICLRALNQGGSAYVIDFPVTHLGAGDTGEAYEQVKRQFIDAWSRRQLLLYVCTPIEALFLSRSRLLRRVFGGSRAINWVGQFRRHSPTRPTSRPPLR